MQFLRDYKYTIRLVLLLALVGGLFIVNVVRWSNCDGDYVAAVSWTGWTCIEETR